MVAQQAWFAGEMARPLRVGTRPSRAAAEQEMPLYGGAGRARAGRVLGGSWWSRPCARGRHPADLVGDGPGTGDHRPRTTASGARHREALRLSSARTLPDGPTPGPPALHRRLDLRVARLLRAAGDPGGVRGHARTTCPTSTARTNYRQVLHNSLLPGRRHGGPGTTPTSTGSNIRTRTGTTPRAALRPDRRGRGAQAAADRAAPVRRHPRRGRLHPAARAPAEAALVVSSFLDTEYPFTEPGADGPTSSTRCGRRTSRPDSPTCRWRSPGRATGSAATRSSTWCPRPSSLLARPGTSWPTGADGATVSCPTPPARTTTARTLARGDEQAVRARTPAVYGLVDTVEQDDCSSSSSRPGSAHWPRGQAALPPPGGNGAQPAMRRSSPPRPKWWRWTVRAAALLVRRVGAGAMVSARTRWSIWRPRCRG